MRDIRFRAWDKKNSKMYQVDRLDWLISGEVIRAVSTISEIERHVTRNFILMQYTGLKDRTGREIFDGDIIKESYKTRKRDSGEDSSYSIGNRAVKWGRQDGDYEQTYFWGWMLGNYGLMDGCDVKYDNPYWECLEITYEVIGNIYESPELLGVKP